MSLRGPGLAMQMAKMRAMQRRRRPRLCPQVYCLTEVEANLCLPVTRAASSKAGVEGASQLISEGALQESQQ